jgi:general secretion pathway protein I
LSPALSASTDRSDAGFTLVEALVALVVVAVSIPAIGAAMSTNLRGVKTLESHAALMQSAQAVLATAIPPRGQLVPGVRSGQVGDFRWQVDSGPLAGDKDANMAWIPQLIRIEVRSPSGAKVDLQTVRLTPGLRQ